MLEKCITDNYDVEVKDIKLFTSHFGTEIFIVQTNKGKYFVKTVLNKWANSEAMENEGHITEYVHNNGISVARLSKTKNGMYHAKAEDITFHVQEYIEGEVLQVNTAPAWFMEKSAITIGEIHSILKSYGEISRKNDFLDKSVINHLKNRYTKKLKEAKKHKNSQLIFAFEERIRHFDRVLAFDIDASKLTYSNAHSDFNIRNNIVTADKKFTVIDWTTACRMPVCFEVIRSYVFAEPACRCGKINSGGFIRYLNNYLKYFSLNDYDIQMMPYIFYFQQMIWNYTPPFDDVVETYMPMCKLIQNFTKWLYDNVEKLSEELL